MENSNRKVYLDIMRIIACFLVIYNHSTAYHHYIYYPSTDCKQWVYMFFTMITRINVPLFFMITGILLLGKVEDFKTIINKRISRFFIVIVLFSCLYVIFKCIFDVNYSITVVELIQEFLNNSISGLGSYWYLYAYLGLLFMLPFMQRIAKSFSKQDFIVVIALHFIFSTLLPIINLILSENGIENISITYNFSIPIATISAFFYPLIGYYIENNIDVKKLNWKKICVLLSTFIISVIITCSVTYYEGVTKGEFTQNYVYLFDYLITMITFILIKYFVVVVCPKISEGKISSLICVLGSLTFGIYLLNPFLNNVLYKKYEAIAGPLHSALFISIGWCIISMLLGGMITYILKKMPVFRKIL